MRNERVCWALGTVWHRTVCSLNLGGLGMIMKWHLGQVSTSHFTTAKYSLEAWVHLGENNWLPLIVRSRNQTDYHEGIYWKAPESYSVATSIFNHLCCCAKSLQSRQTLWDCSLPGSSVHGDVPGKNTGVGCHALPARGSSQSRDGTQVSCIAGGFFTVWATREAQEYWSG